QPSPLTQQTHLGQRRHQAEHVGGQAFHEFQGASHGVGRERIHTGTEYQFTAVGLAHVDVQGARDDHGAQKRFDRFGHGSLKRRGSYGHADTGHIGNQRSPAGGTVHRGFGGDIALGGTHPGHFAIFDVNTGDFVVLNNVHTHFVGGSGIAPHHGVVSDG